LESKYGIPVLKPVFLDSLPEKLIAFNDLGRSISKENEVIHFYKSDDKLVPVILDPLKYLNDLIPFSAVLTPDVSVTTDMHEWMRVRNTVYSRIVGVVYQAHGLSVIPSLRWSDQNDYDLVAAGLPPGGTVAFSNVGLMKDHWLKAEFSKGLEHFIQRLKPTTVLLYGSASKELLLLIPETVRVRHYRPFFGLNKLPSGTKETFETIHYD
jgi:hypothetical protein